MSNYPSPYQNDGPSSSTQSSLQLGYYPSEQGEPHAYQPQSVYQTQAPSPQDMEGLKLAYDPGAGPALTGMILGIIGLFLPIVSIVALIFSIRGMKSTTRKGMAISGLVMSILGVFLTILVIVAFLGVLILFLTPGY